MGMKRSLAVALRRHRFWRGSATLIGAIMLSALAAVFLASERLGEVRLFESETMRETGRLWGTACVATHRAVQSRPAIFAAPRTVAPAQLKTWSLLPDGLNDADGRAGLVAAYGSVLADGAPLAVCSLSGSVVGESYPELREGALMAGLDLVGFVGGADTAMHDRLADVEAVLGTLAAGSMFMTGDFGIGHASERVYRRAVGGRPELASVEQDVLFQGGFGILGAGSVVGERADVEQGSLGTPVLPGRADSSGDIVVGALGRLTMQASTRLESAGGFAFGGGAQSAWSIPGELAVGSSLRSRGEARGQDLVVAGGLEAGGDVDATVGAEASGLVVGSEVSARSATFSGALDVRPGGCAGCILDPVGGP